jgi:uncharacterized protein YjdB
MTACKPIGIIAFLAMAGCSPHEAAVTHLRVSVTFDASKVLVDQLRFEVSDAGVGIGHPALKPEAAGELLTSPTSVAILLPDSVVGHLVHVKVTGLRAGVDGLSGESDATPSLGAGVDVQVELGVSGPKVTSVEVTPGAAAVALGANKQLMAVAHFSDNRAMDVTAVASWASSDEKVAVVNASGLVGGVAPGMAKIRATYLGVQGSADVTVGKASLVSISVTPGNPQVPVGTTLQLTATGHYSDGSNVDVTGAATWSTDNPGLVAVDDGMKKGLVTGVAAGGGAMITAKVLPVSGGTTVSVTNAQLASISVSPDLAAMAVASTRPFFATGLYSDNSTQDLTSSVTWTTADPAVATVSNAMGMRGVVSALKAGGTAVTATLGKVNGSAQLTVTAATLTSIAVTPTNATMAKGTSRQFTAIGTYSDQTTQDLTATVTWSSSTMAASISPMGLATADNAGMAVIAAVDAQSMVKGSTNLTVSAATIESIAVEPAAPSIAKGTTVQLRATGTFSDKTVQDLTQVAVWASSNLNVAKVNAPGLIAGAAAGMSDITAGYGGKTGMTTITVSVATLMAIDVTPANATLAKGSSQQYRAIGTYSDNSTQDLTNSVTWASDNGAAATISNGMGTKGLLQAVDVGMATISATSGNVGGTAALSVSGAQLTSIAVAPVKPSVAKGTQLPFTATGTYSDQTTQDLTTAVT